MSIFIKPGVKNRVESGSDDPDNLGHLSCFFGGPSGSHHKLYRLWYGVYIIYGLSRRKWSPATTGPPDHLRQLYDPPDQVWQTLTATDGPALPQVVPLYSAMLHAINDI